MSFIKELHIASPYNDQDLIYIKRYCRKHHQSLAERLEKIRDTYSEEEYEQQKELAVINREIYYTLTAEQITNLIEVEIEKDKKVATVYPQIHTYVKDLIPEICNDLIELNGMEQVFVFIRKNDQKTIRQLLEKGFLSLLTTEDQDDYIPFLKEKEIIEKTRESRRI